MNKREYLLVCLMEECAEVQKAASKALRFGLEDGDPFGKLTNAEDLRMEIIDFTAIVAMLEEDGIINLNIINLDGRVKAQEEIDEKRDKVNWYMEYSKGQGTLTE